MLSPITNERQWRDPPCLWFGNCYWKPWELLPVLWRQWRGPSGTVARSEYPPPSFSLNQITKRYTLVAVGDLLPHNQFRFVVDVSLRDFLADADYLITNFEGVITDRPRVNNPIVHRRAAIDWLAELFPLNRTITGVANNHAGDGGYRAFAETCDCLRDAGCHVVGTDEELQIVVDGVLEVAAGTDRRNTPSPWVAWNRPVSRLPALAPLRIFMPHWGRELTLLPATWQRGIARKWLKDWHWIVGSHTHCPQPLEAADGRLIAYSMGNLCWGAVPNWPLVGLAIRCEVGTRPDGTWALGSCRWAFVRQLPEGASQLRLVLQEACPFVRAA